MCGNMLFMDPQKSWLLIGRAKLISTNGPSFTFCTQPLQIAIFEQQPRFASLAVLIKAAEEVEDKHLSQDQ